LKPQLDLARQINKADDKTLEELRRKWSRQYHRAGDVDQGREKSFNSYCLHLFYRTVYFALFPLYFFPAYLSRKIVEVREVHLSFQRPIVIAVSMVFYVVWIVLIGAGMFYFIFPWWCASLIFMSFLLLGPYLFLKAIRETKGSSDLVISDA